MIDYFDEELFTLTLPEFFYSFTKALEVLEITQILPNILNYFYKTHFH